jgi:hypothetical protein
MNLLIQVISEEPKAFALAMLMTLSLVLPLMASRRISRGSTESKRVLQSAWTGQILIGVCGLFIIFSSHSFIGLVLAPVACVIFGLKIYRQTELGPGKNS